MMVYPSKQRYDKKNLLKVSISFNRRTEPELIERIEAEDNKAAFIKKLVRDGIEKEK